MSSSREKTPDAKLSFIHPSSVTTFGQLMPCISTLAQLIIADGFFCCDRPNGRIRFRELVRNWLRITHQRETIQLSWQRGYERVLLKHDKRSHKFFPKTCKIKP